MFRIGIIGTENGHAHDFVNMINKPNEKGEYNYPDCRVTCVWGHYPEANERIVNESGAERIAEGIDDMLNNVDAVMITSRDGKFHYEFAEPFIKAGIPAFVDKPFTVDKEEALKLINLAKEKNVPLAGGSMLKFADSIEELAKMRKESDVVTGAVVAPLDINSEYSGFFFYASHLVEMTLEIFGYNPEKITAVRRNDGVCAIVSYESFSVTNNFNTGAGMYSGAVYAKEGCMAKEIDLSMCAKKECDAFINMLRTGEMPYSYEKLAVPVFYMNAVKEAYETGKTVAVDFTI